MRNLNKVQLAVTLTLAVVFLIGAPSIAVGGGQEGLTPEEDAERQAWADNNFEAIMAPQNEAFNNSRNAPAMPVAAAESITDALSKLGYLNQGNGAMTPYPSPRGRLPSAAPTASLPHGQKEATVEVPLEVFDQVRTRLNSINDRTSKRQGPTVALGSSEYSGMAIKGALALDLRLQVTLGQPSVWKTVPLVGDDVVLVSGMVDGEQIPVSRRNGYHVWVTERTGEVTLELKILVPSRGPRGSLEYDFLVARTPVTRFSCSFPVKGLEPRLDAAVQSEISPTVSGTLLEASLKPTTRIHLVGFKDMGESEEQPARVFAESLNLLSVDEKTLDLFAVIRYTILYSGTRQFDVEIPDDMSVVSADGEGAFRFTLEEQEGKKTILRGETAYPIRNGYEISLRLKRQLPRGDNADAAVATFEAPIPRCLGVEREHGWFAVEVPGKLRMSEKDRKDVLAIDVRQLPAEMVASAVSPIIKSYRYHSSTAHIGLEAAVLPDMEPSSGSIDRIRAFSVISAEGKILTDMRITMRNRLRPTLALDIPEGVTIRSVHLDGEAIRPSKDEGGRLMLPLKRSEGRDRLVPFTVQVVMESAPPPLGLFGMSEMALPAVELPASSTTWSVFLPANNIYSALAGDVETQSFATEAIWHQSSDGSTGVRLVDNSEQSTIEGEEQTRATEAGSGLMAVRIELPKSGTRLDYSRYWLEGDAPLEISFRYLRSWLTIPATILLTLLMALACLLMETRFRKNPSRVLSWIGLVLGLALLWPISEVGGTFYIGAGVAIGMAAIALRRKWLSTVPGEILEWGKTLGKRLKEYRKDLKAPTTGRIVKLSVLGGVMIAGAFVLLVVGLQFISLLGNPL